MPEIFNYPQDDELQRRLRAKEDNYVERKTEGDLKDIVNTFVAFANSVPMGQCGILFVGVKNGGEVVGVKDSDNIQKSLTEKIDRAYPRIERDMRVLVERDMPIVCVAVPGSQKRPHFAGGAYVRDGSEVKVASQAQYEGLIAEANVKIRKLRALRGRYLPTAFLHGEKIPLPWGRTLPPAATLEFCGAHSVTLRDTYGHEWKFPVEAVSILEDGTYPDHFILQIRGE